MYPASKQVSKPLANRPTSFFSDTASVSLESLQAALTEARQAIEAKHGGDGEAAGDRSAERQRLASALDAAQQILDIAGVGVTRRA